MLTSDVSPPIEERMKSVMTRPNPERKWNAIRAIRPDDGEVKRNEAADDSVSVAAPNPVRHSAVAAVSSVVPVNSSGVQGRFREGSGKVQGRFREGSGAPSFL